jgi:flagellar biosynthetic protein FliR
VIDLTAVMRVAVLIVRPGMLFATSPLFGGPFAPAPVKAGLTLLVALALLPATPAATPTVPVAIAVIVAREAAIGFALALAIRTLVAAAEFGGHLCGFQLGLGYAAIVDPQSSVRNDVVSTFYSNVTLITLFATNSHHAFLRALRDSYLAMPIGAGGIDASLPRTIVTLLRLIFTLGMRLAAPLIVVMVVSEIGMGLLARSAPSLNVMVAGPSVRVLVGLAVLALVLPAASGVIAGTTDDLVRLAGETARAFR